MHSQNKKINQRWKALICQNWQPQFRSPVSDSSGSAIFRVESQSELCYCRTSAYRAKKFDSVSITCAMLSLRIGREYKFIFIGDSCVRNKKRNAISTVPLCAQAVECNLAVKRRVSNVIGLSKMKDSFVPLKVHKT